MKIIDKNKVTANIAKFAMFSKFDSEKFNISGYLVNEYYKFFIEFDSMREMFNSLETIFDYYKFPMATHNDRVFSKKDEVEEVVVEGIMKEYKEEDFKGKQPSCEFRIEFRYNSTWQGTLNKYSDNKRIRFNSELEFINIMLSEVKNWN